MVKRIDYMDRNQTSVCDCWIRIDRKQFCNMKPKVKKLDVLSMNLECATANRCPTNEESQAESYAFMLRTLLRLGSLYATRKPWKTWLKYLFGPEISILSMARTWGWFEFWSCCWSQLRLSAIGLVNILDTCVI